MKNKSLWVAAGMGVVLFLYGYIFSTVGHDHGVHEEKDVPHGQVSDGHPMEESHNHNHAH